MKFRLNQPIVAFGFAAFCLGSAGFAHNGPESEHLAPPKDALCVTAVVNTGSAGNLYQSVPNWCQIPDGKNELGSPTHGGVAVDKAGNIYFSMDGGPHGIMVYAADGKLVRGIADKFAGIHGLMINEENGRRIPLRRPQWSRGCAEAEARRHRRLDDWHSAGIREV